MVDIFNLLGDKLQGYVINDEIHCDSIMDFIKVAVTHLIYFPNSNPEVQKAVNIVLEKSFKNFNFTDQLQIISMMPYL